jgi:hypothetical protein
LKLSNSTKVLGAALVAYVVFDILLTPLAHLETRPVAAVTGIGIASLGLLFAGLALAIIALVLLVRRSSRTAIVAMVAAVLILPAVLAEQTGHFSSFRPPTAIEVIELVQVVVVLIILGTGVWIQRRS